MKRMMKKVTATLLTFTMLLPGAAFADSSQKEDVSGHWAKEQLSTWIDSGLMQGYPDGSYKPNQPITRAELATLINRTFNLVEVNSSSKFSDLSVQDPFYQEILKAVANGYMNGYADGTIKPDSYVSRQEAAVMLGKAYGLPLQSALGSSALSDVKGLPDWSRSYVNTLVNEGYVKGYTNGTFGPERQITRAEAVTLLQNISGQVINKSGTYSSITSRNVVISQPGVTLEDTTIEGNLYLTQGIADGDVVLNNVTVKGQVIASGGGENTVHLQDSAIRELLVNKLNGNIRLLATGSTNIDKTYVLSGASLEEQDLSGAGFLNVALRAELPLDAVVRLSGEFERVEVDAENQPTIDLIKGLIKQIILNQPAALQVGEGAVIDKVEIHIEGSIQVTGKGKVNSKDDRIVHDRGDETTGGNPSPDPNPGSDSSDPSTPTTPTPEEPGQEAPDFTNVSVHDPSIIKEEDTYYVFGSHIEAAKSADLMNWSTFTNGYTTPGNKLYGDLSENLAGSFAWAGENDSDSKGGFSVWAPDVYWNEDYINEDGTTGAYMMYYSASSTYIRSAIGIAVSQNIEGPYTYVDTIVYSGFTENDAKDADSQVNKKWTNTNIQGLVDSEVLAGPNPNWFKADGAYDNAQYPNAIDATLFKDEDGRLWMTYGSWSGGIFLLELDPETGRAIYPGEDGQTSDGRMIDRYFGIKIAGGHTKSGEGPFIVYDEASGYYYLTVSYGWLGANGGYNIRQFRAENPEGPYLDAAGNDAVLAAGTENEQIGIKLIGNFLFEREIGEAGTGSGYGYVSAGHNSVFYDEELDKHFLFFHTRFPQKGEAHELRVHQMFMNKDGWPVVAPHRYSGESLEEVAEEEIAGEYKFVNHGLAYSGDIVSSVNIVLNEDHTVSGDVYGTWTLVDDYEAQITIDDVTYDGVFISQWDEMTKRETMNFTAISEAGETVWGIQQPDKSDEQVVQDVQQALTLGNTSNVSSRLDLPIEAARNTTITWTTSDPSVITAEGEVFPPEVGEENLTAVLTATITKGDASRTKDFNITVTPIDVTLGLSAQYSFEENLDASVGDFGGGTITGDRINNEGGAITYEAGVQGKSAVFDGNSGIKLPNGLIEGNEYSVSMWLNPAQTTQFTTAFFGGSDKSWISFVPHGGDGNTMLWSGESWYDASTGSRIRTNQWHHVAFSVNGEFVKVFVNGEEAYSGTGFPHVFTTSEGVFSLGVNFWDTPFKGKIDELKIYDVAITAEVAAKLAEDLPPREEGPAELQAQYSFEENLADTVGNFEAGTVIGNNINTPDGGNITYQDGAEGKAAIFDGKSGVRLPNGLISSDSYSVTMWVYADELPGVNTTTFFGALSNASWLSLKPAGPEGKSMLWSNSNGAWYNAVTGTKLPLSEWTHLAFTVAGDQVKVYVNGEEKFTGSGFPDIFLDNTGTFSLAVNWWDIPFKGMMDELRIYQGAISAEEVQELATTSAVN